MEKPQSRQTLQTEEEVTLVNSGEEATLVAPRFDDEETMVARPVVPLDAEAAEAHAPTPATYATTTPATYARRSLAPRRSWMLALVLISVLVGGVLGGAGLYIYQRQSREDRAVADTQAETPAETQTQQPAPEPTVEASNAPQPEAPTAVAEPTDVPDDAPAEEEAEATVAAPPAREPETEPAAGRRDDTEPARNTGTRKRGKKGQHDEETERQRPVARADADDEAPREARRVDTIFYRERRAMRRERARARREGGGVDRLRRIFEGTPE